MVNIKKKYKHWSKKTDEELIEDWMEGQRILKQCSKEIDESLAKFDLYRNEKGIIDEKKK